MQKAVALAAIALALGLPLLFGACGGDGGPAQVVSVRLGSAELGEYSIALDRASIPAGKTRFEVRNEGEFEHDFIIIDTNLPANGLKVVADEVDIPTSGWEVGSTNAIPPGGQQDVTVNIKPGRYVIICNIEGHYQEGTHTTLEVTPGP